MAMSGSSSSLMVVAMAVLAAAVGALPSGDRALVADVAAAAPQSFLEVQGAGSGYGALNLTSLTINSGPARESKIVLGDGDGAFTLALTSEGAFAIRHRGQDSFVVSPEGDVQVNGKLAATGTVRIEDTLSFMGVHQWLLAVAENFAEGSAGWTNSSITTCGSSPTGILGGYGVFAGGEATKIFRNLPQHSEVRLKANFHFIDAWTGESAFTKVDHQVVWIDSHDHQSSRSSINICGGSTGESKFAVPIDVVIPHEGSTLSVTFGSQLAVSALEASWGVSNVQLWVRK